MPTKHNHETDLTNEGTAPNKETTTKNEGTAPKKEKTEAEKFADSKLTQFKNITDNHGDKVELNPAALKNIKTLLANEVITSSLESKKIEQEISNLESQFEKENTEKLQSVQAQRDNIEKEKAAQLKNANEQADKKLENINKQETARTQTQTERLAAVKGKLADAKAAPEKKVNEELDKAKNDALIYAKTMRDAQIKQLDYTTPPPPKATPAAVRFTAEQIKQLKARL